MINGGFSCPGCHIYIMNTVTTGYLAVCIIKGVNFPAYLYFVAALSLRERCYTPVGNRKNNHMTGIITRKMDGLFQQSFKFRGIILHRSSPVLVINAN